MANDNNLQFITEKIRQLRSAVMYSMSSSLVKLPNDIVTSVKVDEEGQLWFLSHSPAHLLKECEQVFPVRLHFFRKGYDFFVEVSGKATIVNTISTPGDLNTEGGKNKDAILIKMTMANIEYTEPHARKEKTKLQVAAEKSYKWMLRNIGFQHTEGSVFSKINH
ncbi:MAG: pyridoxamine 5'-phosphate oxidase family protein [Ferruginibacter sp.]|nr:pyridoxamine 5'-phosphate oxidase family protein [Chitinophagaceae bacterium]